MHKKIIYFIALCLSLFFFDARAEDFEYWQTMTIPTFSCGRWKSNTYLEARLNHHASDVFHFQVSQRFYYEVNSWIELGMHYTFIESRNNEEGFRPRYRLELEITALQQLSEHWKAFYRGRLEINRRHGENRLYYVIRHRDKFSKSFKENSCKIDSIGFSNEIFYEFSSRGFHENRFIPIEIVFNIKGVKAAPYFMLISRKHDQERWRTTPVLGFNLDF
jgi:hypothetical protein